MEKHLGWAYKLGGSESLGISKVGQREGFTQASQLQGLDMTIDHQPLPSVEDQLYRGRAVVLPLGL